MNDEILNIDPNRKLSEQSPHERMNDYPSANSPSSAQIAQKFTVMVKKR